MTTTATNTFLQQRQLASSAFSMPGFVGLYFGLRAAITFLFFRSEALAGSSTSLALNLLLLAPVAFYAAGPSSISFGEIVRVRTFRFVLLFLALGLVSLTWTEAQSPIVALTYWAALAADVGLVVLVMRAELPEAACESIMKGFVWGVFVLSLIAWAAPTMPDLRIGDDDFLSPNVIGFECAMGVLFCQFFAPQGARWKWLGTLLAITLLRSLSKTSIIAFLVAESFFLLRAKTLSRGAKLALGFSAALVLLVFSGLLMAYYNVYTHAGTQAETLTGRTAIWFVAWSFASEKPWLGHGFHSFHSIVPAFGTYQAWHAHNELLQQLFNYGVVGVVLVVALYSSFFRQLRRCSAHPLALTAQSMLLLVFVRGLTDTERFDLSLPLWMITAFTLTLAHPSEASL
jgi:exopolysaccharide production protein ExoQ